LTHHLGRVVCPIMAVAGLAVSQVAGWLSGVTVGSVSTGIAVIGGAIVGLRALAIVSKSKADSEAWATGERIRMQVEAERERLEAGSLTKQVDELRKSLEANAKALAAANAKAAADLAEANRVSNERLELLQRETQARVEDANKKLHQIQTDASADIIDREAQIREIKAEVTGGANAVSASLSTPPDGGRAAAG
jgi:hypothetical protein